MSSYYSCRFFGCILICISLEKSFTQNETSPLLVKCCTIKACLELLIFEQGGIFIVTCDTGRRFTRSHPKSSRLLRQARVLRTYPKQNPLRIIYCVSISWLHCYIFIWTKITNRNQSCYPKNPYILRVYKPYTDAFPYFVSISFPFPHNGWF